MSSATERRPPDAAARGASGPAVRRPSGSPAARRRVPALAAALLLIVPHRSWPAATTTPAELRSILDKTDSALSQAERAVGGNDPGKVSLYLQRVDELLVSFQESSGLEELARAFDEGRRAAGGSDLAVAAAAVRRAADLMSGVSDFVVLRQAAETSRSALRAAEAKDAPGFMTALDRFDASILAPVLLARVREARAAVARARQAMVYNNMQDGRARIGEARRAFNGLSYAGALSRATFSLTIGAELLEARSVISGRDYLQKALRDLKLAVEVSPDDSRPVLEDATAQTTAIWKRASRPAEGDPGRLADLARSIDTIRLKQPH